MSDIDRLSERVLRGEVRAGARLIRLLEDQDPRARMVLSAIHPHTGAAQLVGVTGPPGAGKSTLVDALVTEQRRRGRRVGVLAIDPSSAFSGGAVLGDRIRMQRHAADEGVFIRSMGTRGQLGGLSRASYDAALVLDAMGYEVIFIETVGVGQDEIDIAGLAHTTMVIAVPGLGDEVQAMKAGLLEIGELFVVNKADRAGANDTLRELELLLHLRESAAGCEPGWRPPLHSAVASLGSGITEIVDSLDAHAAHLKAQGSFARQSARRSESLLRELLRERLMVGIDRSLGQDRAAAAILDQVRARRLDPYRAAERLAVVLAIATPPNTEERTP